MLITAEIAIALSVWWSVWGHYGFWWGVWYGLMWNFWFGYRMAEWLTQ